MCCIFVSMRLVRPLSDSVQFEQIKSMLEQARSGMLFEGEPVAELFHYFESMEKYI